MAGQELVTAKQLLEMEGFELVRGVLVGGEPSAVSGSGYLHGIVAGQVFGLLWRWVEDRSLGRVCTNAGFLLERDPDTVCVPDVAFVRAERHVVERGCFPGAPDLAVEVVSPSDKFSDVQQKTFAYLDHGARAVWVVDPGARIVTVYGEGGNRVLTSADTLSGGEILPGFELAVAELFAVD